MSIKKNGGRPKIVWAYGYEITPPQPAGRLRGIRRLLEGENTAAKRGDRSWSARVVHEQRITHLLVVSDSAEQDLEINKRLERELEDLKIEFSISAPMVVADDSTP